MKDKDFEVDSALEFVSPYCDRCGGCGEEGCCSPLACTGDGDYCAKYLLDLKFAYALMRELQPDIPPEMFDRIYDKIYGA